MTLIFKIVLIIFIFSSATIFGQGADEQSFKGLLNLEKEVTYWDINKKKKRSEGYFNPVGFSSIGEKYGTWKFYYEDGGLEELSNYYAGKYNGEVRQFYPNGRKKFEGVFFLGVLNGEVKAYYSNGNLAEEGSYNSIADSIRDTTSKYWSIIEYLPNIKVGKWKYFHQNGQLHQVTKYKDGDTIPYLLEWYDEEGKQFVKNGDGVIKKFYASGKPEIEMTYKDGLLTGPYKKWSPNGKLLEIGSYDEGKMDGNWNYYFHVSGNIYQEVGYKEGIKHGVYKEYTPNDTLVIAGNFNMGKKDGNWVYNFENGQIDMQGDFKEDLQEGHWVYYYPHGQLYYEGDFEKGKKTNHWTFYYNNGQLWREGDYKDDKKDGVWNFFYESGSDLMEGSFNKDLEHGLWTSYYENGEMKDRGSYNNGLMTAKWEGWFPNGKLKYEGEYLRDFKTGEWKYYNEKGKLTDVGSYKILKTSDDAQPYRIVLEDELSYKHGNWKSYGELDGKLVSEGNYKKGKQTGTWKFYYPGGKVVAYQNDYNDTGQLNGTSKSYTRRGKLVSEINYKDGKKHGDAKVYDKKGKLMSHIVYKNGQKVKDVLKKKAYKYGK